MKIQLIRHATSLITINDIKILVDPMLSPSQTLAPVANSANDKKNPLVDLPVDKNDLLNADGVILTHTHRDHFDEEAAKLLSKHIPIFCQPEDEEKLIGLGFVSVHAIKESYMWKNINFIRTQGQHGTGEIGKKMAPVSGFMVQSEGEPSLYIVGDSIWCSEVKDSMERYKPEVAIVYSGAAQFLEGGPITMSKEDVLELCRYSPGTKVVVAHMEAWNHCLLTRNELRDFLENNKVNNKVYIPNNGDTIKI